MKQFFFSILFFLLFFLTGISQSVPLSEYSHISIITVGPGDTSIDCYGHSAIRVKDPVLQIDMAFNYGMYDFRTKNFYLKFAQGKLPYKLGNYPFHYFLNSYKEENRTVTEQVLNLTKPQRQAYFMYLLNNAKPENSSYLYDFFYDNCATKLRDVSKEVLKDKITFKYDFAADNDETLRDLIHNYSYTQPWGTLGIDIALGSVIDRKATPEEHIFLPDNIYNLFKESTIDGEPLIKDTRILYQSKAQTRGLFLTPLLVLSILAAIVLYMTFRAHKKGKRNKVLDFILFFVTGLVGILILLLWFATDHSATAKNFNFLWAFPLNLIVAFFLLKKNLPRWLKFYLSILIGLLLLTICLWLFGIQAFHIALIPVFVMLTARYVYLRSVI